MVQHKIDSLEIKKALVGKQRAGKTTFFSLLLDLIQPTTGTIINNGVQVNTSELGNHLRLFLMRVLIGYLTPKNISIS
jgi:ABC-2 type transport system ATP-binding protein